MAEAPPPSYETVTSSVPNHTSQTASTSQNQSHSNDSFPPEYPLSREPSAPPYRARHAFATSQEELAALNEFARSKLYVTPGTQGTLSHWGARGNLGGLGWTRGPVAADNESLKRERMEAVENLRRGKEERKERERRAKSVGGGGGGGKEGKGKGFGGKLRRVLSAGSGSGDGRQN